MSTDSSYGLKHQVRLRAASGVGGAAGWVGNQASSAWDTATHLCLRTGGGDYNSNNNGSCQTAWTSAQGLDALGVVAKVISGAGIVGGVGEAIAGGWAAEAAVSGGDIIGGVEAWNGSLSALAGLRNASWAETLRRSSCCG